MLLDFGTDFKQLPDKYNSFNKEILPKFSGNFFRELFDKFRIVNNFRLAKESGIFSKEQ